MSDNIHVAVRMRPLIKREKENKASVHWIPEGSSVVQKNQPSNKFQFDRVFREIDTNEIVYAEFCSPLVKSVIDGFNGTIFAYGQTSSGKTFTLMGKDNGKELGIAHYTISDIFNHIQERSEREFLLRVSYMEIYNESVFDLLSDENKHMKLTGDGLSIKVSGLSEHIVQTSEQVLQLMRKGEKKRKSGQTNMNERSSRSHSIFQVIIESGVRGDENSAVNVSQFNLVDLAGSERVAQTGAKEERLTESKYINKSLLMLSQVIRQLSEKPDQFINYRDSKLTRILQNSLGGNANTAIICTITPATVEETLSTLKFATQAKRIRNKPQVNEVLTEQALLKRYANEIKKLSQELLATKEEKDQENKSLKEQILSLRNKFVSQMAPTNEKRSARRETWGGCLDANKFKMPFLPPLKKMSAPNAESFESSKMFSPLDNSSFIPEKEPLRRTGSIWSNQCDLSTVDEESEVDVFDGTFLSRVSKRPSIRLSGMTYSETGVQTEISSVENRVFSDSEEQVMNLQTRVKMLEDELAELQEFTSLEKQYYAEYKLKKSGYESLLHAGGTPQCNVSRFSLGDENGDFLLNNKQSSTPFKNSHRNIKDFPVDLVGGEKDRLFEYLNDTIKILGKRTHEGSLSMTENLNTQYQVFLKLFSMVLQHQFSKVKDNEYLSTKLSDTLETLSRILSHFDDKSLLQEGMIEEFMNKTNDLLKEIEMFSLDFDDKKASTENNVMLVDISEANHCFDVSVMKRLNFDQYSPAKTSTGAQSVKPLMADAVINTSIDLLAVHENPEVTNLKSQIAALEKDVANHLKTISELQEDIELKNDELQLQNEIAECLKDELSAKDKEIDSYKMVGDTCAEEKLNCSSQTSYLGEHDTNTEKLSILDGELCKSTKIISDLEYERDSKDKQIALCKDKIRIQEQIILSLQTEIALKTVENSSNEKPLCVNSSSQTFYLGDLSQKGYGNDHANEHEISVFEDTSLNHDQEAENSPKLSPIKNIDTVDGSNCCEVFSENRLSADAPLKLALKEFTDLKQFAVEFMERNMDEVYFRSVCESGLSEKPASVQDLIKVESSTVRKLLQRIEFYLKDKCENYEYFQDVLRDTSNEVVELKSQLSDAESHLKQTKGEMQNLYEAFKDLESKASIFLKEFEAPKSLEWKDSISSDDASKALKYISLLRMVNKMLKYFVEERKSLSGKTNSTLEVVENSSKHTKCTSQAIQTIEDERLVKMSKELEKLKTDKESLETDVSHLNSRIETIKKFREEAEGRFKDKESRYKTEIQNLKTMFESEKNIWTENASKCVKSVEEKYDQLINEQEGRFCEELNRVKDQLKELIAKHEKEVVNLQKDHSEKMTHVQDKLSNALTAHFQESRELEETISNLKKEVSSRTEAVTKLKFKCKSYATELHQLKASAKKSTSEVGVQAGSSLAEDKKRAMPGKERALNVVAKDFSVQTSAPEMTKMSDNAAAVLARKNEALEKDIEDLKRDLSSKMMLLRSCRCTRVVPPAPGKNKPAGEKSSESNTNSDQTGTKKAEKRGELIFSSAAEVLQSDIVKKAIELEVERNEYKLSDSGTASTMVNIKLKKDLHSRDRALAAAKKEIAELKAYAKRRNALPVKENIPFPSSEDVTEYHRDNHPYPLGEVPKLPTKNMIKEKYQVPQINHPTAIKIKDQKDILCEKPVYSNANPSQAPCVKSNRNDQQAKEKFKRDLENFRGSEPECKQQ